jgi:hypothetical protein
MRIMINLNIGCFLFRKGMRRGPVGPPGPHLVVPLELAALPDLDLDFGLLCDVPIGAHFNTSHDKAHCALSRVGAGLRRY